MKVLHVYRHDNPRLAEYVRLLSQAMPADVECAFADNASDVRLGIKDFQPDIIHQHGQPTANNQYPIPPTRLVVSPHGETVDIAKAYAVIARSPYELSSCDTERKELVRNPLITKTITFEEAAAAIHIVYQRVMDSHPLELMDTNTRHLLAVLLKAGLLGDKGWVAGQCSTVNGQCSTVNGQWPTVNDSQFRLLFIYASLEGVLDIVERGIKVLSITDAEANSSLFTLHSSLFTSHSSLFTSEAHHSSLKNYLPQGYKTPVPLDGATIPQLLRDIDANGITLLRLTELMKLLYDDSLDEDALLEQIDDMNARPQLQLLLQILSEQMLLTEGFMPCPPLDNSFTENLRQQIENHLRVI